jgi:hypothetical protein
MKTLSRFVAKFTNLIVAVLSCFDRVIFKGYLPFTNGPALEAFVDHVLKIRRCDFLAFAEKQSKIVVENAQRLAQEAGLDSVKSEQDVLRKQVEEIQEVADTLDPEKGNSARCQTDFQELIDRFVGTGDPFHEHMAKVTSSFQSGLVVGGDEVDQVRDNLDLERWFRLPKGHERQIHGHKHARGSDRPRGSNHGAGLGRT